MDHVEDSVAYGILIRCEKFEESLEIVDQKHEVDVQDFPKTRFKVFLENEVFFGFEQSEDEYLNNFFAELTVSRAQYFVQEQP